MQPIPRMVISMKLNVKYAGPIFEFPKTPKMNSPIELNRLINNIIRVPFRRSKQQHFETETSILSFFLVFFLDIV